MIGGGSNEPGHTRKIAASDALFVAVSHGDKNAKHEKSGGVALAPGSDTFDIDAPRAVEPQQLQVC